jgi:hypothetical protein
VFKDEHSRDDPDDDVIARWRGAGTKADQVEEYFGISGLVPTRENRLDLALFALAS